MTGMKEQYILGSSCKNQYQDKRYRDSSRLLYILHDKAFQNRRICESSSIFAKREIVGINVVTDDYHITQHPTTYTSEI
jgi:hypothetical protein